MTRLTMEGTSSWLLVILSIGTSGYKEIQVILPIGASGTTKIYLEYYSKLQYMHIGPINKAMVTLLQFILSKELRKEAKPHGENIPSRKDMRINTKNDELLVLPLLQTKCWFLDESSSWEEEKSTHLDQEQLQDRNWDHVERLRSNDV